MSAAKDGGPAFPSPIAVGPSGDLYFAVAHQGADGMSLRAWFAGQALPAVMVTTIDERNAIDKTDIDALEKFFVQRAVAVADQLLEELAK